jgi:hypothetical protein
LVNVPFDVPPLLRHKNITTTRTNGYWILALVEEYITSPVGTGLISTLIREWPYQDYTDVHQVRQDMSDKEMCAAMAPRPNVNLNYSAWFGPNCRSFRLAYNIPVSPVQDEIQSGFLLAKVTRFRAPE